MTVLQEPVQVKTHRQFVVTSRKQGIYDSRAAISFPASAAGQVRGVTTLPRPQAPQPAADFAEPVIGVICIKIW